MLPAVTAALPADVVNVSVAKLTTIGGLVASQLYWLSAMSRTSYSPATVGATKVTDADVCAVDGGAPLFDRYFHVQ